MEEAAYIKAVEDLLYIRVQGHITAALCPELKARAFARLDSPEALRGIYLDLSACEYMDSTFLGLIVGLNKRLEAQSGRKILLLKPSETCLGLLRTIGVLKLVEISQEARPFPSSLERVGRSAESTAEFLLDAHEELAGLSEENKARFTGLTTILRAALKKRPTGE